MPFLPMTYFQKAPACLFPYGAVISFVAMCLITSSMAVARGHVSGFVHISDTGTVPPESCVFGIMLTFFAVMVFFSVWNVYTTTLQPSALHGWVSIIGSLSAVGVIIVVNFQKITVFEVHIVGALTAFGPATVYIWLMLVLSPYMRIFRKFCAALVTFSLIATCMTDLVSILKFKGKDRLHWKPDDGGYELHVASVISEWFMVLGINLYIATLSTDIKRGKQRLEKRRGKKNMTQNEAAKKARLDVVQTQVVRANGKQRSPAVKNDQSSTKSKVNHIENNNEVALRSVDRNVPNVAHPIYQLQELI